MIRLARVAGLAALVACLIAVALSGAGASAAPIARAAKSCSYQYQGSSGYITNLKVKHVSCSKGKRVAKANYSCHVHHHGAGDCRRTKGYRCSQSHRHAISTQFYATSTCKRGHKRVQFLFQVNT